MLVKWDLIAIGGLQKKLCALKVAGVLVVGIPGLSLGSCGSKNHLDVAPVERCKVYYMGEGGGFPRVQVVVSLVSPKLPMARLSTKGALESELTNLWLVGCRFEWVIKKLVTHPSFIPEPQHAPLPLLVLRVRSVPRALNNSIVWPTWIHLEFNKELGSMSEVKARIGGTGQKPTGWTQGCKASLGERGA
jgi:hypothetical protein